MALCLAYETLVRMTQNQLQPKHEVSNRSTGSNIIRSNHLMCRVCRRRSTLEVLTAETVVDHGDMMEFNSQTEECLERVLEKHLEGQVYNEASVASWMDGIMQDISKELATIDPRHQCKRIVNVTILKPTEVTNITTECQCFWNEGTDHMISYTYRNVSPNVN